MVSSEFSSLFAKESCSDIAHVCLLELVVSPTISIDADVFESGHYGRDVEAHLHKSANQILVVTMVSAMQSIR